MRRLTAQKRLNLLREVYQGKKSVTQVCREFGVSRYTFYKWAKVYQERGGQPEFEIFKPKAEIFKDRYLCGENHWRSSPRKKERAVLEIAAARPHWGSQRIASYLSSNGLKIGNHGVQNILKRTHLKTVEERLIYQEKEGKETILPSQFSPAQRLEMIEEVKKGKEKISTVCRHLGISRYTFYKWYKRYLENPQDWLEVLNNRYARKENHPRFLGREKEKLVLDWVAQSPQYSCRKLSGLIPQISYHGIQNILTRNNLNTYQRRLAYQASLGSTFTPLPAPLPSPALATGPAKIFRFLRAPFATVPKFLISPRLLTLTFLSTLLTSFIFYRFLLMLSQVSLKEQAGLIFATISLTFGLFFFLYSLKYYFTLILILGFSRQVSGPLPVGGLNGNGDSDQKMGFFQKVFARNNHYQSNVQFANGGSVGKRGFWQRIFGTPNHLPGVLRQLADKPHLEGGETKGGGLQPDLSQIKLQRNPFVSVHLPIYNEKRVVDRLLTACTAMDYENYEIVVVDDSTDETTEIVEEFARRWNENLPRKFPLGGRTSLKNPSADGPLRGSTSSDSRPFLKVIHRETREGFKGGALREALRASHPQTEFVIVFDADFLPYPDTITQFLKYFQATAGGLDFRKGTRVQALGFRKEESAENSKPYPLMPNASSSPIAAIQGYQWHVLNKSENWITRGVRSEYAGSYVIERSGEEALGALKQIAGSVYMIRKDILDHYGWGTSITEDFELTLKLYRDGFKVVYTPYIQTPSECVSTLKRLVRQRMRWAEGHSHNIKRMFGQLMRGRWEENSKCKMQNAKLQVKSQNFQGGQTSVRQLADLEEAGPQKGEGSLGGRTSLGTMPLRGSTSQGGKVWVPSKLTLMEKLEFLYLSPYYFQAAFFMLGTFSWFISEALFQTRLPFWTSLWGWSLVFTNLFSLPLMNTVGLFLEESEERDYIGALSFIFLSYLLVPFQGYAALKGFLEKEEGPWFRTPKTGRITDIFTPGRFARLISAIFPGRRSALAPAPFSVVAQLSDLRRLTLATVASQVDQLRIGRRRARYLANSVVAILLLIIVVLTSISLPLTPTLAYTGTFYFRNTGADVINDAAASPRKQMSTATLGTATQSTTLDGTTTTFYILTDNLNKKWTSGDVELPTEGTTSEQRNPDIATVTSGSEAGSSYIVWEDERNSQGLGTWSMGGNSTYNRYDNTATLLLNGKVLVVGTYAIDGGRSIPEIYDPVAQTWSTSGYLTYSRAYSTATLLQNGKILVVGTDLSNSGQSIPEIYDPQTQTWSATGYLAYRRYASHTATLLPSGKVLVVGGSIETIPELFDPSIGTWSTTGATAYLRDYHTATLLNSGKVLITGTSGGDAGTTVAEIYDPIANTWSRTGIMAYSRFSHTATLLPSGKVLVLGDYSGSGGRTIPELFDSQTQTFSTTGTLTYGRSSQTATILNNGKVLVVGTGATNEGQSIPELYDPSANTWVTASTATYSRVYGQDTHAAVLLNNGKVFIVGSGGDVAARTIPELYTPKTADIYAQKFNSSGVAQWGSDVRVNSDDGNRSSNGPNYDHLNPKVKLDSSGNPIVVWQEARNSVYGDDIWAQKLNTSGTKQWPSSTTGTWSTTAPSTYARSRHSATLLQNGKVLVAGTNQTIPNPGGQSIAELYDPSTGAWSTTGNATYSRYWLTTVLLNNGKVLAVGTGVSGGGQSTPEIYDPSSNTWTTTGAMTYSRSRAYFATLLSNGKVLLAGTYLTNGGQSIAELYDPSSNTWSTTGAMTSIRYDHTATLLLNGKVLVVGADDNGNQSTPEIYDPSSNTWSTTGSTVYVLQDHTATLLQNGKVLVAGTTFSNAGQSIAEIYDPSTQTWTTTGPMTYARRTFTATLLNNGKVLVAGATFTNGGQSIAELYDPSLNSWTTTGAMTYGRDHFASVYLRDGKVLATGSDPTNSGLSIAELYTPAVDVQVSNDGSPTNGTGLPRPEYPNNGKGILGEQRNPTLAIDSGNNAVVAWEDSRFAAMQNWGLSFNYDSNAWRQTNINLAASGACNGGGGTQNSCGAIPLIQNNPLRIMGQKLLGTDGSKQWGNAVDSQNKNNPQDLGLAMTGDFSSKPAIAADGANVIVTWESNGRKERDNETRNYDIYGQKFNSSGTAQWGGTWATTSPGTYARSQYTATLLNDGKVLLIGTEGGDGGLSIAEIYDPSMDAFSTTTPSTYGRYSHTATLLGNGKVLLIGTDWGDEGLSIAEIYDPSTGTFSTTGTSTYARANQTATLLGSGKVLVAGTSWTNGGQSIAELYDPSTGTFSTTAPSTYRYGHHTATILGNGRVLLVGGQYVETIAEIYDPSTNTFSTVGNTNYGRDEHTATLLSFGKVLLTGTWTAGGSGISIAELYDPSTGTFSTTGTSTYARANQAATLLQNGKVLLIGTAATNGGISIAELYDPSTGTFTTTATSNYNHTSFSALLLGSGKVLVVGGSSGPGQSIAEIYSVDQMINSGVDLADQRYPDVKVDSGSNYIFAWQGRRGSGPGGGLYNGDSERGGGSWKIYGQKTNNSGTSQWLSGAAQTWITTGSLSYAREYHTATLLNNGKVLAVGTDPFTYGRTIAELYDPSASTWTTTGYSTYERGQHTAVLLANSKVLFTGSGHSSPGRTISEIYDPSTQAWTTTGPLAYARRLNGSVLLSNGKVLTVGTDYLNDGITIAELYDPSTNTWTTTGFSIYSRSYNTATLLGNGKVLAVGTYWGGAGESIPELYDPQANTWTTTGPLTYPRFNHTATLLNNGKVLITGVDYDFDTAGYSVAELYDPATNTWTTTGALIYSPRYEYTATLLANGKVLVAGTGWSNDGETIPEIYDPSTNTWTNTTAMTYSRDRHTATLLINGKVLVVGSSGINGDSIPELYTPEKSEMMLSHDYGMKGDQEKPKLAVDGTTIYGVWEDNRSAISTTLTSDKNIFMQKFSTNGEPQWPAATSASGYASPYAVMDIRADTYAGGWGSHYSGKPAIGGVYTGSGGEKPLVLAWQDNRNSGDSMDIYGQSYDTLEQDISKSTNWDVFFDVDQVATLAVKVGIMEWDGTTASLEGSSQTWNTCSPACPSEQTKKWDTEGSNPPPSDTVGNVTMRRLRVAFTRTNGSVTIYYDNSTANYDSRLSTGNIVPEKALIFGLIVPFLPPTIGWYMRRRRKRVHTRMICECK